MTFVEIIASLLIGFLVLFFLSFVIKLPTNDPERGEEEEEEEAPFDYDPSVPDPWESPEVVEERPDVDTLIEVLRSGEPGPCRKAVADLVAHGEAALPALRAAAEEGDPDLRIDAERAIELIEGERPS